MFGILIKLNDFVKYIIVNFYLYDFKDKNDFINQVEKNNDKKVVIMNVGTKKYFLDSFASFLGDKLKKLNLYVYGSTKREINGKNFLKVYEFIKKKHKGYKVIIIDSVYSLNRKKPILIYSNEPINVSFLSSDKKIGDAGILFNSFSYSSKEFIDKSMGVIENIFLKISQKI